MLTSLFIEQAKMEEMNSESIRADRFVRQCELVRKQALEYRDSKFFANFGYQQAFLCQYRYMQGGAPSEFLASLQQAVTDFIIGLELGYPTEAKEINNWFYRSLVVNQISLSHFLASLPAEVWPYGEIFPRFQAYWGFAEMRKQHEEAAKCLDFLYGWCFESGDDPEETKEDQQIRQLEQNCYYIMHSISMKDNDSAAKYLHERCRLRPIIPPEGTRYELFQPLDLLGLGLCRIAMLNGLIVKVNEPSLPMELIFNT